jgi:hypothetical protein
MVILVVLVVVAVDYILAKLILLEELEIRHQYHHHKEILVDLVVQV